MLKELLALNESVEPTPDIKKKISRTLKAITAALKPYCEVKGETVKVTVLAPNKAQFTIDFKHWMRPETIHDVNEEFEAAIKKSDEEGHIHKISVGDAAHGDHYIEALLSGLRPGMKLTAEAFFPTAEFEVTWKQVTTRKSR